MSAPARYPRCPSREEFSEFPEAELKSTEETHAGSAIFACPSCHGPLGFLSRSRGADALTCPACGLLVPVVHGCARFADPLADTAGALDRLARDAADSASAYANFLGRAAERGGLDLYAAFEPFNEAT